MLSKTIKDAFYNIKRANGIEDKYLASKQPYEKYCLHCGTKLEPTEQLNGFCTKCDERFGDEHFEK